MRRIYQLFTLALISLTMTQCQKEVSNIGGPDPVIVTPAPITANLQGNILDENNNPAAGVTVRVGNQTVTTNAKGFFKVNGASLDKQASVVTAEKAGYFKAYRTFAATSGANQVIIKLIQRTMAGTVNGTSGGDVSLSNGSKIALQANGVVNAATGAAYTGTINVYAAYIDPTGSDIDVAIPGSLMANDKNGNRVVLTSYGMLAVELEGAGGEKLQVKTGSTATITTAIPSSMMATAPATIPLWYVDEQTGVWKEEGTATKSGNVYVGDVKHFTFWNCDFPNPAVNVTMTIKNPAGLPIQHIHVAIRRNGNAGAGHGYSDSLGQVGGLVPANEPLTLQIYDMCNNIIYSQNIGPFSQSTNLGDITITNPGSSIITIEGNLVNCSGNPVTSGYAMIYFNNYVGYVAVNPSGHFVRTIVNCSNATGSYQIIGVDNTTQQQGNTVTIPVSTPTTNAGTITACGNSAAQYVNYTLDGTNYSVGAAAGDSLTGHTIQIQGTTNYSTAIAGNIMSSTTFSGLQFEFQSPGTVPGTYTVGSIRANSFQQSNTIIAPFNVVITNFPAIGQFYEGTLSGQFKDASNVTHTVSASFRVRRQF